MSQEKIVGEIYLHIGDGGVKVSVIDEGYGPTLKLSSSHYGNNLSVTKLHLTPKALRDLGQMLLDTSETEFSKTYTNAARELNILGQPT